jgi:hypothetical protein
MRSGNEANIEEGNFMNKLLRTKVPLAMAGLVLLSILSLPNPALAIWVHGNSGHLELEGSSAAISFSYVFGSGIDFVPGSNTIYWAHYAIPLQSARYVNLRFYTGVDSNVTDVDVYNAESKLTTVAVPWGTGWRTISLDMGSNYSFSMGLGISIKCVGGPDAGIGRFRIAGVGASTSPGLASVPLLLLDQ